MAINSESIDFNDLDVQVGSLAIGGTALSASATELNQTILTMDIADGSAAGDVDSCTPSALNTVTAGQAINFVVAGGGVGGSPRVRLAVVLTR